MKEDMEVKGLYSGTASRSEVARQGAGFSQIEGAGVKPPDPEKLYKVVIGGSKAHQIE